MTSYLEFAEALARKAGVTMLEYFSSETSADIKADQTPVTIADIKINQMVIDSVAKAYPDHTVLGEELSSSGPLGTHVWVCDPIDGTHFFNQGIPLAVFMISLVIDGQPVVAVVYDPVTDRMFTAEKDKGAFLNGRQIHVSDNDLVDRNWIDICDIKDHPVVDLRSCSNALYERGLRVSGIRVTGMVLCMVAEGGIIAGITPSKHPHDVAAAKLIVEEAGGRATDVFGNDQRYDGPVKGLLFSNGVVHDELVDIITQRT